MSSKPADVLDWGTDSDADVVQPSTGYRSAGYAAGDPQYAPYENWVLVTIDEWLQYVRDGVLTAPATSTITVSVDASDKTYTRSAGSFVTDGFKAGQHVYWSGFTNAGNNGRKVITDVTATVITVSDLGLLVDEAGTGNESCTAALSVTGAIDWSGPVLSDVDFIGQVKAREGLVYTGLIDASPSGNQNNYNPTGLASARGVKITTASAINITGLAAQEEGRELWLWNQNAADAITLKHASGSSSAANTFELPGAADLVLGSRHGVLLVYTDLGGGNLRWIAVAGTAT